MKRIPAHPARFRSAWRGLLPAGMLALCPGTGGVAGVAGETGPIPAREGSYGSRLAQIKVSAETSLRALSDLEGGLSLVETPGKEAAGLAEKFGRKQEELAALKNRIRSLKDALKTEDGTEARQGPLDALRQKLEVLEDTALKLKKQKEDEEADLARLNANPEDQHQKAGVGKAQWANLAPKSFVLIGMRVVEINGTNYKLDPATRMISRVKDGESVDQALEAGGRLRTFLDSASPQRAYVLFWVYPDAVPNYRRLAEEVKKSGFKLFWRPEDDKPFPNGPAGVGGGTVLTM